MKKIYFLFYVVMATLAVSAQTVLLDEDFANGIPDTWSVFDRDQLTPNAGVSQVTDAWVHFTTTLDTCAISTSYYDVGNGQISQSKDYLVTPKLNLLSYGHLLTWASKSFDANYPETYYVLLSKTDSLPESFTDTLKIVTNDAPYWKTHTVNLFSKVSPNDQVYVAFRNASIDAFLLGIDDVIITTNDPANIAPLKDELSHIEVYPNPIVSDLFLTSANGLKYEITNLAGQVINSGVVSESRINFEAMESGVYFVSIFDHTNQITKKVVKR